VNVFDDIQFYLFNHHHYIDEPPDSDRYESTWVTYPNANFRPDVAYELYQRWTREMLLAEQLGFDAIAVNEHHQTVYSMQPGTTVRAGYLAALTKRVKILVAGTPINLSWPSRVAEEYAMLDVMSGGRMEFGFPLGTGMEYWSNAGQINPATARDRFREGLGIIIKTWTEDGPIRHDGQFYNYRYLNVWPRPMQKPHPKIYIVGSGSKATVDLAADFHAGYSIVFTPIAQQLKAMANFREIAEERGWTVQPDDTIFTVICYVADTDEEAVREARPHIEKFFSWMHRVPNQLLSPPGYVSRDEFLRRAQSAALSEGTKATWDDMVSIGRIICGSPDTVADTLSHWAQEAQCSRMLMVLQHGDMPEWKAVKNMHMFAKEVIPRVRARATGATAPEPVFAGVK
jgi:alkanesulfonate monooxygenase SsuD/methylene tetrahydromethanopterin reductase-like flavin-dependent oxidoreductase (luciferase family)